GRADEAIDRLERASSTIVSPDLYQALGDLRLAKGDTVGAAREYAVIAADPVASSERVDSLRQRIGWAPNDARWRMQMDSAAARVMPLVLIDLVDWTPTL